MNAPPIPPPPFLAQLRGPCKPRTSGSLVLVLCCRCTSPLRAVWSPWSANRGVGWTRRSESNQGCLPGNLGPDTAFPVGFRWSRRPVEAARRDGCLFPRKLVGWGKVPSIGRLGDQPGGKAAKCRNGTVAQRLSRNEFSCIGRAGSIWSWKSLVPRSLRALYRPEPRSLLGLRKHLPRNHFPHDGIVTA